MHYPTDRIAHTTAFVTPVVEHWLGREIHTCKFNKHFSTTSDHNEGLITESNPPPKQTPIFFFLNPSHYKKYPTTHQLLSGQKDSVYNHLNYLFNSFIYLYLYFQLHQCQKYSDGDWHWTDHTLVRHLHYWATVHLFTRHSNLAVLCAFSSII